MKNLGIVLCTSEPGVRLQTADLRLCFHICKEPVFSCRGSYNISTDLRIRYFHVKRELGETCDHPMK